MFVEDASSRKKKLGLPFQGPYRVVQADDNNVEVRPVGRPDETSRWLNVERVRLCPQEIPTFLVLDELTEEEECGED